jgi:nitrate/nitrite transporter NarK
MTTMSGRATTRHATHDGRRAAVIHRTALAVACYLTYWLITHVLSQVGIALGVTAGWAGPGFTVP